MADTTLIDPLGRSCILHDHTWYGHILKYHPDMDGGRDLVEDAVRNPISIWISKQNPHARLYYAQEPTLRFTFVVAVNISTGIVYTAHIIRKEEGEKKEWPL